LSPLRVAACQVETRSGRQRLRASAAWSSSALSSLVVASSPASIRHADRAATGYTAMIVRVPSRSVSGVFERFAGDPVGVLRGDAAGGERSLGCQSLVGHESEHGGPDAAGGCIGWVALAAGVARTGSRCRECGRPRPTPTAASLKSGAVQSGPFSRASRRAARRARRSALRVRGHSRGGTCSRSRRSPRSSPSRPLGRGLLARPTPVPAKTPRRRDERARSSDARRTPASDARGTTGNAVPRGSCDPGAARL
jgi:hypothetical protein